MTITRGHL